MNPFVLENSTSKHTKQNSGKWNEKSKVVGRIKCTYLYLWQISLKNKEYRVSE